MVYDTAGYHSRDPSTEAVMNETGQRLSDATTREETDD